MIIQYLQEEGYVGSVMTIQDESNVRLTEQLYKMNHMKKMKKSILGIFIYYVVIFIYTYFRGRLGRGRKIKYKKYFQNTTKFSICSLQASLFGATGETRIPKSIAHYHYFSLCPCIYFILLGIYLFDKTTKTPRITTNKY